MNPLQLTKRIEELSEKLKPVPSEGIRIDFHSFTEPEQLVILKNAELNEKYRGKWTKDLVIENKDLITKCNGILIERVIELFLFSMPRAMILEELEQWFFEFHFHEFIRHWIECTKNLKRWSKKDREDFLRDVKIEPKSAKKNKHEVESDGEEDND